MSSTRTHLRGSSDKRTRVRVPLFLKAQLVELIELSRGSRASSLQSRVPAVADYAHEYILPPNNIHFVPQLSPTTGLVRAAIWKRASSGALIRDS